MALFEKDNHARDEIRLLEPSAAERDLASAAFLAHFGKAPREIQVIEGANINSANFRCDDKYLKCVRRSAEKDFVLAFPGVAESLAAAGVPVVPILPSASGAHIGELRRGETAFHVIVQPFVTGEFARGDAHSLESLMATWPALRSALVSHTPTTGQHKPYNATPRPLALFLERARVGRAPFDSAVWMARERLLEAERESNALSSPSTRFGLHHFDLHPHNLLFRDGSLLAVLDLESFRWMPEELSLAFGLFKCGRKGISLGRLRLDEFRKIAERSRIPIPVLKQWVNFELLRRLKVILEWNYEKNDPAWNGDFPKHLGGLAEAEAMFS